MRVSDAVERIAEVLSGDATGRVGCAEEWAFVEPDVVAQGEGVCESVVADIPSFGNAWFDVQVAVESHESVVQLAGGPDECLVFGKGGVEAVDACRFVVSEDGFAVGIAVVTACGHDEAACEEDEGVSFHEV